MSQWTGSAFIQLMVCCLPVPSHYLNQWCLMSIGPLGTNLSEIWIDKKIIHQNASESVICEMAAILSRGRWVKLWPIKPCHLALRRREAGIIRNKWKQVACDSPSTKVFYYQTSINWKQITRALQLNSFNQRELKSLFLAILMTQIW